MEGMEQHIEAIRNAAKTGQKPSEILVYLLHHLERRYVGHIPRIDMEYCLMKAFKIPLREARDIEGWVGFGDGGTITDDQINEMFSQWIR